jgi:uncharacterized membrane protein
MNDNTKDQDNSNTDSDKCDTKTKKPDVAQPYKNQSAENDMIVVICMLATPTILIYCILSLFVFGTFPIIPTILISLAILGCLFAVAYT